MTWSARQYLKFEDERTRPARDLLQAVLVGEVRCAADLGCGPGNSTELIVARFPAASVVGVDNAADMIRAAKERLPAVRFELAAIEGWSEPRAVGPRLRECRAAMGGWPRDAAAEAGRPARAGRKPRDPNAGQSGRAVACGNEEGGHERAILGKARLGRRRAHRHRAGGLVLRAFEAALRPRGHLAHDLFHPLAGGLDAIVEWLKGTGLTPFLKPLSVDEQAAFLVAYKRELAKSYTPLADGTVMLPFPRLFIVATR